MVRKGWTAGKEAAGGLHAAASTGDIKMTDHLRLENGAGTKGRQSEQVARSFMNCPDNCPGLVVALTARSLMTVKVD